MISVHPQKGDIKFYYAPTIQDKMATYDAANLFSVLIIHQINTFHFGEDDIDSKYQIYSPSFPE